MANIPTSFYCWKNIYCTRCNITWVDYYTFDCCYCCWDFVIYGVYIGWLRILRKGGLRLGYGLGLFLWILSSGVSYGINWIIMWSLIKVRLFLIITLSISSKKDIKNYSLAELESLEKILLTRRFRYLFQTQPRCKIITSWYPTNDLYKTSPKRWKSGLIN